MSVVAVPTHAACLLLAAVPIDRYNTETFECDLNLDHNDVFSDMTNMAQLLHTTKQLIGVTGPADIVNNFQAFVSNVYPGMSATVQDAYSCGTALPPIIKPYLPNFAFPPLLPYFKQFASADDMNTYLTSKDYADDENLVRLLCAFSCLYGVPVIRRLVLMMLALDSRLKAPPA